MENNQVQQPATEPQTLPQTQPQQAPTPQATTTNNGLVPYNLDGNVFMPKNTKYLGVMLTDWKRLKKMLSQCQSEPDNTFSNIAYTLFGVSGSAFVSLISTLAAQPFGNHDTLVSIILFILLIVTAGVGFICLKFQSRETEHNTTSLKNVNEEMETIEDTSHLGGE